MNHPGLIDNHKNYSTSIWTWHGTEDFLGLQNGQGSNRDLNPDGCLLMGEPFAHLTEQIILPSLSKLKANWQV
jgi:hypothetical protein